MEFVNREDRAGALPLIDAALAHYQFEAIHPFADGNSRVGRMLITLTLIDNCTLPQPLLYMSPYLERHKDRYIDPMYAVSQRGAWTAWIPSSWTRWRRRRWKRFPWSSGCRICNASIGHASRRRGDRR